MKPTKEYPDGQFYLGEALTVLKSLPDNYVHSIVTDPPYGISFMGKKWDYEVPSVEIWRECLRVLKPGGYLLAFAGTRTQHRMAVNIEDAGFEIRDMIAWVYGSGFPKSHNIGKAVDKLQGNERELVGKDRSGSKRDCMVSNFTGGEYDLTKGTSEWEGWGTALKPALEPITVARKPLSEKSVAENVLKWGTGGINIDGCRVEYQGEKDCRSPFKSDGTLGGDRKALGYGFTNEAHDWDMNKQKQLGRFPANLIHDGSDEVVELFPNTKKAGNKKDMNKNLNYNASSYKLSNSKNPAIQGDNGGSASRFFYCAKASKSDRTENGQVKNNHPTVKPTRLMRYLVKLLTVKGGIVLDPFMGSGTTAKACFKEGVKIIGIDRDEESFETAVNRFEQHISQTQLF